MIISIVIAVITVIIFAMSGIKAGSFASFPSIWLSAYFTGFLYTGKYMRELSPDDKVEIVIYYSVIQMIIASIIVSLAHIKMDVMIVMSGLLIASLIVGFCMYRALGRGCRKKMKSLQKKGSGGEFVRNSYY